MAAKDYGLGDLVHDLVSPIAELFGVKDCAGCKKRREALNKVGKRSPCKTCGDTRPKKR